MDWNNTKNLYIEGDNLEVLKLLQKSYAGKIKMIYIDPPYNTGKDFVYKDNYKDNLKNYQEVTGQLDSKGNKLSTNSNSDGRFHSNWLNMMYPRLRLARNLLTDDGVIFISIDDNEIENLKKLGHEVFGESNHIATLPTIMNLKGNNDQFAFAGTHEYTLVFSKNINQVKINRLRVDEENLSDWEKDEYGYFKLGANLKTTGINAPREKAPTLFFPLYIDSSNELSTVKSSSNQTEIFPLTDNQEMSWRWSKEKFESEKHNLVIKGNKNDGFSIYKKTRSEFKEYPTYKPKSLFYKPSYSSSNGTKRMKELFGSRVFDYPKPLQLIYDFIAIGCADGIVLDFFSGSGTTSESVFEYNLNTNSRINFICVQLPEIIKENTEAFRIGFNYLTDISKERIIRSANDIKDKHPEKSKEMDLGFKVFKLDSSNIKSWDGNPDNVETTLLDTVENIKPDRTEEDVLYEILLKYGLDLTLPIEEKNIEGRKVYNIGLGSLFICLADNITRKVAEGIGQWKKECKPEICRVVFRDNGFSDVEKTNSVEILKHFKITEIKSI
ncbi:MAG: site-specific DNA-methyltransferase [Flavobacteriaceae bacterium]|nr:site-specific DNA-methyltransferase [Flavobacteriaceae bacterium]